jgi:hypothetical protein
MVVHTYNPSPWKAEAGGCWLRGQPSLHNGFRASLGRLQGYINEKKNRWTVEQILTQVWCGLRLGKQRELWKTEVALNAPLGRIWQRERPISLCLEHICPFSSFFANLIEGKIFFHTIRSHLYCLFYPAMSLAHLSIELLGLFHTHFQELYISIISPLQYHLQIFLPQFSMS